MPMTERPDEALARKCVEREYGVALKFCDLTGAVDYRSSDSGMVLEVTRFTNKLVRRDMAVAARQDHVLPISTGHDWWVSFDGYPKYEGLSDYLSAPLRALESHGLNRFDVNSMGWWMASVTTLKDALIELTAAKVKYAQALAREHGRARLFVVPTDGWVYSGPDVALSLLEAAIKTDVKHLEKLRDTTAIERHLWLWTDSATTDDFRQTLASDEHRLPGRSPELPLEVTHLWCGDEGYKRGWCWSPETGWRWFQVT